jgi:hypothetical protein
MGRCVFLVVRAEGLFWRQLGRQRQNPCGGGVEYLHRDPASRRRRRKGKSQIWDRKILSQAPRDYDRERLRWQRRAAHTKDRPVLSSERASHGMKNVTVRRILYSERKKYLVISPRCSSTPRLTDWLTVSRNVTLTLTLTEAVSGWQFPSEYQTLRSDQQWN